MKTCDFSWVDQDHSQFAINKYLFREQMLAKLEQDAAHMSWHELRHVRIHRILRKSYSVAPAWDEGAWLAYHRGLLYQWRTQEFCSWGGVQQIQFEDRENGDVGVVAP